MIQAQGSLRSLSGSASEFEWRNVTCHVLLLRHHASLNPWLSKLASPFARALVEERLTPLNSLYFFFVQIFLKIFGKAQQNCQKCLHFTIEYLTLFVWQSENWKLGSSNQRKYEQDQIGLKLASIFVRAPVEGIIMPLHPYWFSTLTFMKLFGESTVNDQRKCLNHMAFQNMRLCMGFRTEHFEQYISAN